MKNNTMLTVGFSLINSIAILTLFVSFLDAKEISHYPIFISLTIVYFALLSVEMYLSNYFLGNIKDTSDNTDTTFKPLFTSMKVSTLIGFLFIFGYIVFIFNMESIQTFIF